MRANNDSVDFDVLSIKIARNENLPVVPDIVTKVLALTDDPNASARTLEQLVEREPAICAKILRAANSAYYGGHSVSSTSRAISVLGFNAMKSLIVALAYQQLTGNRSACQVFDKMSFWRHCLATGVGARIIGKLKMPVKAEELYGWGIMHDIGILVMERHAPDMLDAAARTSENSEVSFEAAMRELYEYDQTAIGALLADKWNLPAAMRAAIEFHLKPNDDKKYFQTTAAIHVADAIARRVGFGPTGLKEEVEIDGLVLATLDLAADQIPAIEEVVASEVDRAEGMFHQKVAA